MAADVFRAESEDLSEIEQPLPAVHDDIRTQCERLDIVGGDEGGIDEEENLKYWI